MTQEKALAGIRILELGQVIAGTFGDALLADFGAEVIKIEPPGGDKGRNPSIANVRGESGLHLTLNRNKKSVVLDLKKPEAREIFYSLVKLSDVVLDNFRVGVLERLGIDYETLRELNPRIISCSIPGFRSNSRYRELPSFDLIHQSLTGMLSITGHAGGPPARLGMPLADLGAGLFSAVGVLAALMARHQTGKGQRIEVSMVDGQLAILGYMATSYLNTGVVPQPQGTSHDSMVPWQAFECKGGYIVLAPREEPFWRKLCEALKAPELAADPRFETNNQRVENRDVLVPILEALLKKKTSDEWMSIFRSEGVPAAPVNTLDRVFADPGLAPEGVIETVEHPKIGKMKLVANPVQLSETPAGPYRSAPPLGRETDEVLTDLLGRTKEQIVQLREKGVVY
jgi:crotonobetainyl-CoA:carnitine CoA-transferase CaiB-like acyl-CoA transferase